MTGPDIIADTYAHFRERGAWPPIRVLQARYGPRVNVRLLAVEAGPDSITAEEGPTGRCLLTLKGLAALPAAADDLERLAKAVAFLAKEYEKNGARAVSDTRIGTALGLSTIELARLGALLYQTTGLWSGGSWSTDSPTFSVSPGEHVQFYRDTKTFADLEDTRKRLERDETRIGEVRSAEYRRPPHGTSITPTRGEKPRLYGGRWRVVRSLPEGAQAHTFIVEDTTGVATGPHVLKRLKNLERLGRFRREIETISAFDHPGLIRLVAFDLEGDKPFLVMPFCSGGSLEEQATRFQGEPALALRLVADVADALAIAHAKAITHRDLKPANILLREENSLVPVIADFGICFVEDGQRLTLTEEAVGARLYTAPELEDGRAQEVTPRSDVYSLGKVLYWLVAGRLFAREQHRASAWDLVGMTGDPLYEHLNRLLDKMITLDPAQRLADGAEVAKAVRAVGGLMERNAHAVAPNLPQRCDFCMQGTYKHVRVSSTEDIRNFGFEPKGLADWRILVCDQCGHVQLFRIENAARKSDWWASQDEAPAPPRPRKLT